ncbi:MAG: S9 family peptidase, partial [Bacteroidota bacterium]
MNIIKLFSVALLTLTTHTVQAQKKTLKNEDIWSSRKLSAKTIGGFSAMNDGEHYSQEVPTEGGISILRYAFKTGSVTDTLVKPGMLVRGTDTLSFDSYSFSPDEKKILLSSESEMIYRHSSREHYDVLDLNKRTLSRITSGGKAMYATFSPEAGKIAFVRENNLYYVDLSTGKEFTVTTDGKKNNVINGAVDWVYEEEFSMDVGFAWSADGKHLAFYRFDESAVKEFNLTTYGGLYPKEESYKYPKAGEENSKVEIRVYSLESGKTTTIASTDKNWEYLPRIKWTPLPGVLGFQRCNRNQNILELVHCDVRQNNQQVIIHEENSSFIEVTDDLTYLKGGKQFIWTSTRSGYNHIYQYPMDGKNALQITKGDYDVTRFYGYDEKSGFYYYQSAERSPLERHVYSINAKGKKTLLTPASGIHNVEFSAGLRYFAATHSSFGTPYACSLHDRTGNKIRTLEDNATLREQLASFALGALDTLSFLTADGVRLYGWRIVPPDFDPSKSYPVLMHVYGGPGVQTVTNDWDGPNYLWHQLLAQRGIVVVSFDNRGTPGRGLEFANCIHGDMGGPELRDQLEVVRFLKSKNWVDAQRIAVWGWSFGGYMTSLLMTRGEGVFKAGIAVAPVTTWRYYDSIYTERYLKTPQENPTGYDENSPIRYAKDLKGAFLLVHGSTDDNVHMQNTMDFTAELVKA